MPNVTVTLADGKGLSVPVQIGLTLMEVLRDSGVDDEMGTCGGCCSCASCHVYLVGGSPQFAPAEEEEVDLLESLSSRTERSRLACQLELNSETTDLEVVLPPREY